MEMGIDQWEWEGMGILTVFPHISSQYYMTLAKQQWSSDTEKETACPVHSNGNIPPSPAGWLSTVRDWLWSLKEQKRRL